MAQKASTVITKAAWLHLDRGRVLVTRTKGRTAYYVPGGKPEGEETEQETLRREIREELGVDLVAASIEFIQTFEAQADSHPDGVLVRMHCYSADYEGELSPSSEIELYDWFTYADRDRVSAVDKVIFDWLRDKGTIEDRARHGGP